MKPSASLWLCGLAGCALALAGAATSSAQAPRGAAEFVPTFSTNTRTKQQVERLNRLATQKLWDEWLQVYQGLVDDPSDPVMERDQEFLVGVRHHCHEQLAKLPAAVRDKYRARFDGNARRLYEEAAKERDPVAMRQVYSRYRFSSYGDRALLWIANHALDGGQPELARIAYGRLAKAPTVTVQTLLRYALAARAAERPTEARAVLDRIRKEFGTQALQVAGEKSTGAAAADALARTLEGERPPTPARYWTAFAGGAGGRKMAGKVSGGMKKLWEYAYPDDSDINTSRQPQVTFAGASALRSGFLSWPAVSGDRVWVQGPSGVAALSADGKVAWSRSDFELAPGDVPQPQNPNVRGSYYNRSSRSIQATPTVAGHLVITRVPLTASSRYRSRVPVDHAVAAFDARDGSLLWQRTAGGDPRGIYFNLPTLEADTVLTGTATVKGGITEYSAMALDPGTGQPLWTTYLGAGSDPTTQVDGSPAAVKDGLVWIESALYTLNALDLITGEVRLIYRYNPTRRTWSYSRGISTAPQIANEPISLIATGAGPLVFAPRWGADAIGLDPATGRLLWVSPKGPAPESPGALFAVDDTYAYLCGEHVQAINLKDGAREWLWEPQTSRTGVGYAALVNDRIYVPTEGKIQVLSPKDGSEVETLDLGGALGDYPGVATLVVADDLLLVSNRDRVVAFGPK